jgi:hypothetical protein
MHKFTPVCLTISYLVLALASPAGAAKVDNLNLGKTSKERYQMLCVNPTADEVANSEDAALLVRMSENSALCGKASKETAVLIDSEEKTSEEQDTRKSLLEKRKNNSENEQEIDLENSSSKVRSENADVPVPSSIYFLLAGLIGMVGTSRLRNQSAVSG